MVRSLAILSALALIAAPSLSQATDVSGVLRVTRNPGQSSPDFGSGYPTCSASADGAHPSASKSAGYHYALIASTGPVADRVAPPTTVQLSFSDKITGAYSYVLFGSTTTHYSVSADYSVSINYVFSNPSISDSSGTINQGPIRQERDSTPKVITQAQSTTTVTPTWTRTDNNDGTFTYTATLAAWDVTGSANATASGFNPPPGPPGSAPAIPADFSAAAGWTEYLGSFIINGTEYGEGTPPPGGGGGGGGGTSV